MIRDIVKYPNPRLREPAAAVDSVAPPAVGDIVADLIDTMRAHGAVGIAAPQVGYPWRIFVLHGALFECNEPLVFVNPWLADTRGGLVLIEEGCLSFPGVFAEVRRHRFARVEALDIIGQPVMAQGDGLLGQALQHEMDHLNGVLLVDHLGPHKRAMVERRLNG